MPGGGVLFGGWNVETPGVGEDAGVQNNCGRVIAEGDDPNNLRFCDEFAHPRAWRNEYKLSGAQPLPWDLQLAGSLQMYSGIGTTAFFRFDRRGSNRNHTHYIAPWYTADNCVAPCVLDAPRVTNNITGQLGTSPTGRTIILIPDNTVKYKPDWIQVDASIARVFNVDNWRFDTRFEAFNLLNRGVELFNFGLGSRGTTVAGQNSQYEDAAEVMLGRVLRLSMTARC